MIIEESMMTEDVRIVRSNQAVGDLLAAVESWLPVKHRSYEQGVLDTISWLIDSGNIAPVRAKLIITDDEWEDEKPIGYDEET
jgi:hypothetical protein